MNSRTRGQSCDRTLSPTDSVVPPDTGSRDLHASANPDSYPNTGGFPELGELATRRAKRGADQYEKQPQDSRPKRARTARNCARSHEGNYPWKKFAAREQQLIKRTR